MKSVQKNFRTGKIEEQTPEPAGFTLNVPPWPHKNRAQARGMENVLFSAFYAGWEAAIDLDGEPGTAEAAFKAWAKDMS